MQTVLLSMLFLGSAAILAGGAIAVLAIRRAPEGVEDQDGFHFVRVQTDAVSERLSAPAVRAAHRELELAA